MRRSSVVDNQQLILNHEPSMTPSIMHKQEQAGVRERAICLCSWLVQASLFFHENSKLHIYDLLR